MKVSTLYLDVCNVLKKKTGPLLWASRKTIQFESSQCSQCHPITDEDTETRMTGDLGKATRERTAWRWFTVHVNHCGPHFSSRSSGSGHRYRVFWTLRSWLFSPQKLRSRSLFHKTDLSTWPTDPARSP